MSILNQYRQKRVVVSTEDDDTSTTGVVETPEVVINVEKVEKLEVVPTPDIEDAELVGEEKAEMVSSLENHIEETIEQVEEAEQAAEVLEEQADIMENLANSGDATPGAVQAAVSCAGLLINQLGVDVEEPGEEEKPSAVEAIVVSQESIAQDHVQALVVSMEGVKELAGNVKNSIRDTMNTVVHGLSTLFKNKHEIAKAVAEKVKDSELETIIKAKFGENKTREFDIVSFYDLFITESNAGVGKLKVDWSDTLATNDLVLGSGLDKMISTFEKEMKLINDADFTSEEAIEKLAGELAKSKGDYIAPFKSKLEKFDDLGCSGILAVKTAPNKKFGILTDYNFARLDKVGSFEVPQRYRYVSASRGFNQKHAGVSSMYAATLAAGNAYKLSKVFGGALSFLWGVNAVLYGVIAAQSAIKLSATPSVEFTEKDISDAFKYINEAPKLIEKASKDVEKLKGLFEQYELVLAKVRQARSMSSATKVGLDHKAFLVVISQRAKTLSRAIMSMIDEEVKYVNFVQKRTYNFLQVFAAGSRTTTPPSLESYDDSLVYSEEGFWGGLAGFLITGSIPFGGTIAGIFGETKIQKLRNQIDEASDRIAKLRNGAIDEAVKQGTKLPADIKPIDKTAVIKAALWGTLFGPFYGMVKGSQLENENDKLMALIKELEVELKRAGLDINGQPIK